jgi:hypothetical protein
MFNNVWTSIPFLEITLTGFCNTVPRIITCCWTKNKEKPCTVKSLEVIKTAEECVGSDSLQTI